MASSWLIDSTRPSFHLLFAHGIHLPGHRKRPRPPRAGVCIGGLRPFGRLAPKALTMLCRPHTSANLQLRELVVQIIASSPSTPTASACHFAVELLCGNPFGRGSDLAEFKLQDFQVPPNIERNLVSAIRSVREAGQGDDRYLDKPPGSQKSARACDLKGEAVGARSCRNRVNEIQDSGERDNDTSEMLVRCSVRIRLTTRNTSN
jgi:hypothetical protein